MSALSWTVCWPSWTVPGLELDRLLAELNGAGANGLDLELDGLLLELHGLLLELHRVRGGRLSGAGGAQCD